MRRDGDTDVIRNARFVLSALNGGQSRQRVREGEKRPHNNLIARVLQKQVFYAVKVTLLPSKRPTITE